VANATVDSLRRTHLLSVRSRGIGRCSSREGGHAVAFSHNPTGVRSPNEDDNDYRDIQSRFDAVSCCDYLLTTYNTQSTTINIATAHSASYFLAFLESGRSNRWPDPQRPGSFPV